MIEMNVLKPCLGLRWYLTHPIVFFRELLRGFKYAWQRVTKGYSYYDSMDMDYFLLHVIPGMLRDVANAEAYPELFNTYENWSDYCSSLADVFESLQEENWYEGRNEWQEAFEQVNGIPHPNLTTSYAQTEEEAKEICHLYLEREKELSEERQRLLEDTFNSLIKNFNYLWF